MKTAISIPDPIFQAAEKLAHRLRISRSELYTKAVAENMDSNKYRNVTQLLNEIYGEESSELDKELYAMQTKSIQMEKW
ncbi:MAG: hypothetical protein GY941_29035 [Planctomycetes bacterium]|nr:hypothetical protein [Planctomycetota bacterium]